MHIYVYVALRWRSLIRFRRVAVWVCVFVWESINRWCVQRMSDHKKSSGVRDRPSGQKDEFGLSPAAAALTLASIGVSTGPAVNTESDAAIAQALSTGYECYRDELLDLTNDGDELDPDYTPYSAKKIDGTDSKHKPKTDGAASTKQPLASAKAGDSSAPGNRVSTPHHTVIARRHSWIAGVHCSCDSRSDTCPCAVVLYRRGVATARRFQATD